MAGVDEFPPWNHLILSDSQEFNLITSFTIQYDKIFDNFYDRRFGFKEEFFEHLPTLKTFLEQFGRESCEQDEIVDLD